jgi:hypothetical protein
MNKGKEDVGKENGSKEDEEYIFLSFISFSSLLPLS